MPMTDMPMWRPPVDRPLDSDPAIQLVLNAWRKRKVVRPVFVFTGLAALMFLIHLGFSALGVLFLVGAVAALVGVFQFRSRVAWWLAAAPSLLDEAVAVRVRSEAIGGAGSWTLLSIDGGRLCLRLTTTEASVRQLLARQREVSLVGPNADGIAAVVIDGLPAPVPARVVPAPATPTPVAVTSEDLPRLAATKAVRTAWLAQAVTALVGASLLFDVLVIVEGWLLATIGFVLMLVATAIAALARRNDQHRMVKLLDNSPWQAYPAQLLSWAGNPALVGRLRLALTLPDGSRMPVTARLGASWLVANITATGYLWVAGTPRYGASAAVGVPGQPNIAAVRFEEAQAR
ncbi:hypothetical protein [Kutzneria sp. CA-103260]|uniref:hypothetical protein n=1 Tax=Kutzneria sp. CA-103260 TaxID=2802641 RepID=UPI001BAB4C0B|nr:hypothetical protein [Kutzneria sp. CA-103260]